MSTIYEEVKSIQKEVINKSLKNSSLEKANEHYKKMIEEGKINSRGNNLLTLNEQMSKIKLRYSI